MFDLVGSFSRETLLDHFSRFIRNHLWVTIFQASGHELGQDRKIKLAGLIKNESNQCPIISRSYCMPHGVSTGIPNT